MQTVPICEELSYISSTWSLMTDFLGMIWNFRKFLTRRGYLKSPAASNEM